MTGAAVALSVQKVRKLGRLIGTERTLATGSPLKDAGAGDNHIVDNCEYTLTSHPSTVSILDLAIIQYSSLVQLHAPAVDRSSKRYFIGMEELPAGLSHDFFRGVAKDIDDRV